MITFRQFINEKAMHGGAYAASLGRIADNARIGFELEVLVPVDSTYWHEPSSNSSEAEVLEIKRFDTFDEFKEFFHVSSRDEQQIASDYGSWLAEKADEYADEHWEEYDNDERTGRRAAARDLPKVNHGWTDWFGAEFKSASDFIDTYALEPKFGWARENELVYAESPEEPNYDAGWRDTAASVAKALEPLVRSRIKINSQDAKVWNIYQDTSIKEDDLTSVDTGMRAYGIEIVTPPLRPTEAFKVLDLLLKFVTNGEMKTNESTGLHVNISLGDMKLFDPLKLVLLMGDTYILKKFNRESNLFTRSQLQTALDSIQQTGRLPSTAEEIRDLALDALKHTQKYFSVNLSRMKGANPYLEFRALGGEGYHLRATDIREAIGRWITAIESACDPTQDRQLYLKKVYALLGKTEIAKNTAVIQRSPFDQLVARYAGKNVLDEIDLAKSAAESLDAVRSVFLSLSQDDLNLTPTFEQIKGAREFLKRVGIRPSEVIAATPDDRRRSRLLKGLRLFKLVK